jgi:hypothetical protein
MSGNHDHDQGSANDTLHDDVTLNNNPPGDTPLNGTHYNNTPANDSPSNDTTEPMDILAFRTITTMLYPTGAGISNCQGKAYCG